MSKILDGKLLARKIREDIFKESICLQSQGETPKLAIIQGGNRDDSNQYIRNKMRACEESGIEAIHYKVEFNGDVASYAAKISECIRVANSECHGVILQKPVPHISAECEDMLTDLISPKKDVDCLGSMAKAMFYTSRNNKYLPCTPAGIIRLLKDNGISLKGKSCCVIGRSDVVGRPLALGFLNEDATIQICHSKTPIDKLLSAIKDSDVVVAAVGVPNFINKALLEDIDIADKVIVDVGVNYVDGKWTGDVEQSVKEMCKAYTPTPGGVGPMTIAMLLDRVIKNVFID